MTHRIGKPQYSSKELLQPEQLSELVHRLGHEIDNPLTAVISLAAVIGRVDDKNPELLREKLRTYGAAMASESWRVSQLIGSLVMLCSQKVHVSEVTLNRIVKQASNRVRDREKFDKLPLSINLPDEDELLLFDASQLQSLCTETLLLLHELATEDGLGDTNPQLNFTISRLGQSLTITGSCTLIRPLGFPLDELFAPFSLRNRELRALGLGPAVIWAIVERLGGQVFVEETAEPSGTVRFSLHIKLSTAADQRQKATETPADDSSTAQTVPRSADAESVTVLIIDDEDLISDSLRKILELTLGSTHCVECRCSRGPEVLTLLAQGFIPDVILCDMNLVNLSGRHVHQTVITSYPTLLGKFIFLTADPDSSDFQEFFRETKAPCIRKPFEAEEIVRLIRRFISQNIKEK